PTTAARATPPRGLGVRPLLPGNLPHRQTALRRRPAATRLRLPAPTRPLLLLPRSAVRPPPRPGADLVPVHHPGLRQRPRLAGPPTAWRRPRLRAAGQRLPPTRQPSPAPVPGRPLPASRLGEDPERLGPPGQPPAPRVLASGPGLLLGHRPGRIQYRCPLPR